jgi:hypothetical protein
MAALIREPDAAARVRDASASEFFEGRGLSARDLEHFRAIDRKRLLVYRAMVHGRLRKVIQEWIPRTIKHLGVARFRADFTRFMTEEAPRTRYFRCVPAEFVRFALPRWRADASVPKYLQDLVRHELLHEDLRFEPCGGEPLTGHLMALDRPMRVDGTVRLLEYDYAVHDLLANSTDDEPAHEPTRLLAYRDRATHRVRYLILSARATAVLRHLLVGATVQAALTSASQELQLTLDDDFLSEMGPLLADLEGREVLLGAELTT